MKRFSHIPNRFIVNEPEDFFDYEQKKDFDDTYIVDTSGYVPNKQAVQVLNRQFAMSMLENLAYDLPNEIKSDAVNLFARRKNLDIAELSMHQDYLKNEITRYIDEAKDRYVRRHGRPKPKIVKKPAPSPSPDKKDEH